jgi:membrane protein YqaA with SNARE-associated domain
LITLGATIGIPPQALVVLFAGVIGFPFRTFVAIDVLGRIARFTTIVMLAHMI